MSNGVVFVGREKEIEDFRSAVNSLEDGGRAMLVVGAAGYGKSTLLREFERRCKEDEKIIEKGEVIVIRDEFSRSDDPLSFLSRVQEAWLKDVNPKSMKIIGRVKKYRTYLEGAIDAIATGASLLSPAGTLISSMKMGLPSMPKLPQNMGFLLQAFVADLAEFNKDNPDKRLVLLFDEYHKISNEDIFNAMFDDIIENLPKTKNVLLVIASRKQMVEADTEPLKLFDEYETASFFKENLGITDKKLIAKAQKLLHGHPYSLGLLLRISKEANIEDVIERLPETKVDDYLHKEFFDRLPENVQRFLRKVSVLQILDENVCKFVINSEDFDETTCHNILNQLQKLMVLDELGKVKTLRLYKLHDLFRDFLMMMNETSLPKLHQKAAEYYMNKIEEGRVDKGIEITDVRFALYHLQESGDTNAFVKLLNEHVEGLHMLGYVIESLNYFNNINFEKISDDNLKSIALHNYANTMYLTGKYNEAIDKYNHSLEIEKKLGDQRGIAQTLQGIGIIQWAKGEYDEALDKYNQSLEIKKNLGDQRGIAQAVHNIATIHQNKGEYEEALDKYNQSLEIKKKLGDQRGIAYTLHEIANIQFLKCEYDEALDKYNQSLEIKKNFGDQSGIALTLHNIAMIHQYKGEYDEALDNYNQSLEIKKKLGDQRGISQTLHQIANVHQHKGEYDAALDNYSQSLEIEKKLEDQHGISQTLHQIANVHFLKGEYDKALDKYNPSLEIEKKLGDQRGLAYTLHGIAMIHQYKGEYDEALDKYSQSLEIDKKLGNQSGIAQILHQIAMIHQDKGEYDEALEKYNQSLEIKKKLGDQSGIASTLSNIAMIHQGKCEYDEALEKYNKSLEIEKKTRRPAWDGIYGSTNGSAIFSDW